MLVEIVNMDLDLFFSYERNVSTLIDKSQGLFYHH